MKKNTIARVVLGVSLAFTALTTPVFSETEASAIASVHITDEGLPPQWLQGEPIKSLQKDHLYIFEFWATWCAPCIAQMPHVEALYQANKSNSNLTILGINVFDTAPEKALMGLIKSKKLNYPMAADGARSGPVAKTWLKPLGINAIPCAIAVRNGAVLWQGHPEHLDQKLIELMLDKSFTVETLSKRGADAERTKQQQHEELLVLIDKFRNLEDPELGFTLLEDYIKLPGMTEEYQIKAFWQLYDINFQRGNQQVAKRAMAQFAARFPESPSVMILVGSTILLTDDLKDKDYDLAVSCLEKAIQLDPKATSLAYQYIADLKLMQGDRDGAIAAAEKAVQSHTSYKKMEALKAKTK